MRSETTGPSPEPESTELSLEQLEAVSGGTNIANLRHDMQKTIANNLRA